MSLLDKLSQKDGEIKEESKKKIEEEVKKQREYERLGFIGGV